MCTKDTQSLRANRQRGQRKEINGNEKESTTLMAKEVIQRG